VGASRPDAGDRRLPLDEESREKELVLRRAMLTAHQVGGFLTLGSMAATAYCGQMILNGESGYGGAKQTLVVTTIAGYFTTAAFAGAMFVITF
jgi:hypothetical protein